MYKKKLLIYILILIIIFLVSCLVYVNNNNNNSRLDNNISNQKYLWEIYDLKLKNISTIMDEITEPGENYKWWILKSNKIKDKDYLSSLNKIIEIIRVYYIINTDDGTNYTNTNIIRMYRNKDTIIVDDIKSLSESMKRELNENIISKFKVLNTLVISNDKKITKKYKEEIKKVLDINTLDIYEKDDMDYNDLLLAKIKELESINELLQWVRIEYYKYN